jgi:Holliday junction resolvase RusA-like endonuclease
VGVIAFFIPGNPVAKGRGRAAVVAGHAHVFTPAKTRSYETLVKQMAAATMDGAPPFELPVRVHIDVMLPIPASMSKKDRAHAVDGRLLPGKKPDLDNCVKAVTDGLQQIAFVDDKLICDLRATKRYSQRPGVHVMVEPV